MEGIINKLPMAIQIPPPIASDPLNPTSNLISAKKKASPMMNRMIAPTAIPIIPIPANPITSAIPPTISSRCVLVVVSPIIKPNDPIVRKTETTVGFVMKRMK